MLMGGKARKYWKVGEIHEKFVSLRSKQVIKSMMIGKDDQRYAVKRDDGRNLFQMEVA